MTHKLINVYFILQLILLSSVIAQERNVRQQTSGDIAYLEHYYFQTDSLYTTVFPFRIRSDFFVFTKSDISNNELYSAKGEVSIELLDSTGTSVSRDIRQLILTSNSNSATYLRTRFEQDFFLFNVPQGRYHIVFTVEDKESKRVFTNTKEQINIKKDENISSSLIPVQGFENGSFPLFNIGGDVHFSQNYGFAFLAKHQYTSAAYSLLKKQPEEDDDEIIDSSKTISVTPFNGKSFVPVHANESIRLDLKVSGNTIVNYIMLNGLQLRQGRYEIEFTFPDSSKVKTQFGARWLDMPFTLNDLDLATEPLQFILTKSDYSELRRGGRETRIRKFDEFWKKKDTTPLTAYNEVMHEFYRRVDFAFTAFRTLREMNGAITDRGKIYILYGKPTSTERTLSPGGSPKEIWEYSSSKKIFTFEDPSKQGNYKLAENK